MKMWMQRICAFVLLTCVFGASCGMSVPLEEEVPIDLTSPSVILVEAETGTIIFEDNADEERQVASITKLMTILICMEMIEDGDITLDDEVTVSQNAAAQIGSQALLDSGASYTLEELLKATIIASANDAACAIAEYISGTESEFVNLMNARAEALSMTDTHYLNSTGLPEDGQYSTARDVATLSCEVSKHESYYDYAAIWMDTLEHPSGRITDLTNTNRLVRFYADCDGFKTGSSDASLYCLCATAERDGLRLIAIVLGSSANETRFEDASAMLDYGFANYQRVSILQKGEQLGQQVAVHLGMQPTVGVEIGTGISMLLKTGQEKQLSLEIELPEEVQAPVQQGDTLGVVRAKLGDLVIAKVPAVASQDVNMPGLLAGFFLIFENWP